MSDVSGSPAAHLRHDGAFFRRLAYLGAARGPYVWLRYSPPFFGLAAMALLPSARRAVFRNLERTRGEAGKLRDALDAARTFMTYAGCLAEGLAVGSPNAGHPEATVYGDRIITEARARGKGIVLVTAHTGGWDVVGPLLSRDHGLRVVLAMRKERDAVANELHDEARRKSGIEIVRVGSDPFSSLTLLKHLRQGGVVALQLDRTGGVGRTLPVELLGEPAALPEGPFRLAQAAGAPILAVFSARLGFRKYKVDVSGPVDLAPRAPAEDVARAAQTVADAMTRFLRAHPTQWFRFEDERRPPPR